MTLGVSPLGSTPLGANPSEDNNKQTSSPPSVAVTVTAFAPTAPSISLLPPAQVQVATNTPVFYTGGASYAPEKRVFVRVGKIRTEQRSLPASREVLVTASAPTTRSVSAPRTVSVIVQGVAIQGTIVSNVPAAAVVVRGVGAFSGIATKPSVVQVGVAGVSPVSGSKKELPPALIEVASHEAVTRVTSTAAAAQVVVTTHNAQSALRHEPIKALVWVRPGTTVVSELAENLVVVINTETLAVSEYTTPAVDVVEHGGELAYIGVDGIRKHDAAGTEEFTSTVQTGQIDFGASVGKRCPNLSLITGTDTTPEVYIVDDRLTEYATGIRQGYTDKFTRMYNSPRGVLSTRFGFKIQDANLDFTNLDIDVVYSADK